MAESDCKEEIHVFTYNLIDSKGFKSSVPGAGDENHVYISDITISLPQCKVKVKLLSRV